MAAACLGVGLVLSHNIILIGAGHGAATLGLLYRELGLRMVMGDYQPGAWPAWPIVLGIGGSFNAIVAWLWPTPLWRRISLALSTAALMGAWGYFQFAGTEAFGATLGFSVPFLGVVALVGVYMTSVGFGWLSRRLRKLAVPYP